MSLKEICNYLKDIESIKIDEQELKLEFYLGGDLKFIALVLSNFLYVSLCLILSHYVFIIFIFHNKGLNAANSHLRCPWCTSEKKSSKKYHHPINRVYGEKNWIWARIKSQ